MSWFHTFSPRDHPSGFFSAEVSEIPTRKHKNFTHCIHDESMTDASFKAQGDKYLKNAQWQKAVDAYTSALSRPEVDASQVLDAVVLGSRRCAVDQIHYLSLHFQTLCSI